MKALAASSIGQYERSTRALADYNRTVELGLGACFRARGGAALTEARATPAPAGLTSLVLFGSDQGMVGQFNERVVEFAIERLAALGDNRRIWAVGERVQTRLQGAGVPVAGMFRVPSSVQGIAPLVGQILVECEAPGAAGADPGLQLIYNRPGGVGAVGTPVVRRLLPLDLAWCRALALVPWPTQSPPETIGGAATLRALIREHLFVSLFRACAESLASENTSRLDAMQRADRNIDDLLVELSDRSHELRQSSIDEELFDVVAGFEALVRPPRRSANPPNRKGSQ